MNEGGYMNKQKGMTMISWLAILALVLFNGIIALNVVPVYINDHSVKSVMKGLETDSDMRSVTPKGIKETVIKRLKINNVYNIKKEQVNIKKGKNFYLVTIAYEPRGRLVGNLDYIVSFKHEAKVPTRTR